MLSVDVKAVYLQNGEIINRNDFSTVDRVRGFVSHILVKRIVYLKATVILNSFLPRDSFLLCTNMFPGGSKASILNIRQYWRVIAEKHIQ